MRSRNLEGAWGLDGRTWVYLHREDEYFRIGEFRFDGPKYRREHRMKGRDELIMPRIERMLINGNVLVRDQSINSFEAFRLFEVDVCGRQPVKMHVVPLPFTAEVGDSAVSPTGDRIAFLLSTQHPPTGSTAIVSRFTHSRTGPTVSLCVSRLDGTRPRSLGSEELRVDRENGPEAEIGQLRWLPDGKRLSFVFRDTLWTIPDD